MSEDTKTVEVECVVATFDEENYLAGKTYAIPAELHARYPESFRPVGWRSAEVDLQKKAEAAQAELAQMMQDEYERASDHRTLMESATDIELARQRKELEDQLKKQREENAKASGWQPKPPPKSDHLAESAPAPRGPGPAHTMPRAERLKHASK